MKLVAVCRLTDAVRRCDAVRRGAAAVRTRERVCVNVRACLLLTCGRVWCAVCGDWQVGSWEEGRPSVNSDPQPCLLNEAAPHDGETRA